MTRTFFWGDVDEETKRIYDVVRRANEAAERMVAPGVRFCDIDRCARTIIEDAGYGPYFTHRLGHSIGLEDHEPGDVSLANTAVVEPGMTFSIEPGIYLPGRRACASKTWCSWATTVPRCSTATPRNLCASTRRLRAQQGRGRAPCVVSARTRSGAFHAAPPLQCRPAPSPSHQHFVRFKPTDSRTVSCPLRVLCGMMPQRYTMFGFTYAHVAMVERTTPCPRSSRNFCRRS